MHAGLAPEVGSFPKIQINIVTLKSVRFGGNNQGFTREPQATVARDGTVSPAVGGNVFGSHCSGNGIPRSFFSAPDGTGKTGSYASDVGWERDGNYYMRGMGTGTGN